MLSLKHAKIQMIQMKIPPPTSYRGFYKLTTSDIGDQVFYASLLAQLGEKTRPVALHLDASGFN